MDCKCKSLFIQKEEQCIAASELHSIPPYPLSHCWSSSQKYYRACLLETSAIQPSHHLSKLAHAFVALLCDLLNYVDDDDDDEDYVDDEDDASKFETEFHIGNKELGPGQFNNFFLHTTSHKLFHSGMSTKHRRNEDNFLKTQM